MNGVSLVEALAPINWPTFAFVSARVAGLMSVAPLWAMTVVPARLRGAIAVVLTLALVPLVPAVQLPIDGPSLVVPLAGELLLGLAIGLSAACFLYGVAVAAEVISLQMGLSLGAAIGGMNNIGSPGIGQLQGQFVLAVYVAVGGHLILLTGLARSLLAIPPGSPLDLLEGGRFVVSLGSGVFATAVQVAAPMMVTLLVANLALAVVNRAVPQLNTMMVAVPVTVAVGLIAIGATLPMASGFVSEWALGLGRDSDAVVQSFTPATP
jgi:flagellar biosynthetic protein FliR